MGCINGQCGVPNVETVQVEFDLRGFKKLRDDAVIPKRATKNSAGYDFYIPEDAETVVLNPGETKIIGTGVCAYMQPFEYLDFRIRSGLSTKGLIFMNGSGVIDSDYYPREIGAIMHNLSDQPIALAAGMKIAQGIFTQYLTVSNEALITEERSGGFGSTGGSING